jgi:predicted nuclease of predicted toxin-antitoxin system
MRVLLDHNLPARLLPVLRSWAWVTQAEHVADLGWADADDRFIWKAPSTQPTVIFTKDKDFGVLSATLGYPPKVVLLRVGNCSTVDLEKHFIHRASEVALFTVDASKGLLLVESAR